MTRKKSGFTLIEMLVVIAIIAILAVALLMVLDPIEQLNKTRDGGKMAKAKEFVNACERYYADYLDRPLACLNLFDAGEVKTGFCDALTVPPFFEINYDDCWISFEPESHAFETSCGGVCRLPEY